MVDLGSAAAAEGGQGVKGLASAVADAGEVCADFGEQVGDYAVLLVKQGYEQMLGVPLGVVVALDGLLGFN